MKSIPPEPGFYALELHLTQPVHLRIGQIGEHRFPEGVYIYAGSALGPGGLRARLGRHLRAKELSPHWHIDYLGQVAQAEAFVYIRTAPNKFRRFRAAAPEQVTIPIECLWSQSLSRMSGASIPVPGFGASDCHSGCHAHLVAFCSLKYASDQVRPVLSHPSMSRRLAESAGVLTDDLIAHPISL